MNMIIKKECNVCKKPCGRCEWINSEDVWVCQEHRTIFTPQDPRKQ